MKTTKTTITILLLTILTLAGCGLKDLSDYREAAHNQGYTDDVDTSKLALGGDISNLKNYLAVEGLTYRDSAGNTIQPLNFFKETCGMNYIRCRLFVNPDYTDKSASQDLAYVTATLQMAKTMGMKTMLSIHYSDTWADPMAQTKPSIWTSTTGQALVDTVYNYTTRVLKHLIAAGVTPNIVAIGNEIPSGILWEDGRISYSSDTNWDYFASLLNAGSKAVRETCPDAKVAIHIDRAGSSSLVFNFYNRCKRFQIDYDIIALSYYPFWHGNLDLLETTLATLELYFEQEIMIVEYAYNYAWYPSDANYTAETIGYPATLQGQADITRALINTLKKHPQVTGLFWWFPEENESTYTHIISNWMNRGLFDNETGKATPAAYELKAFRER